MLDWIFNASYHTWGTPKIFDFSWSVPCFAGILKEPSKFDGSPRADFHFLYSTIHARIWDKNLRRKSVSPNSEQRMTTPSDNEWRRAVLSRKLLIAWRRANWNALSQVGSRKQFALLNFGSGASEASARLNKLWQQAILLRRVLQVELYESREAQVYGEERASLFLQVG
jgi:hypothetical protein